MEDRRHLACHAEAAFAALFRAVTEAETARAVRVDEVRYEALFAQPYPP